MAVANSALGMNPAALLRSIQEVYCAASWLETNTTEHLTGVSTLPAALIAATFPFVNPALSVPVIGGIEVALGLALLVGRRLPLVVAALTAHLAGTFLVLVIRPDVAFHGGNPLLLSVEGEYVVKNLVLMAGALLLAAQVPSRLRGRTAPEIR